MTRSPPPHWRLGSPLHPWLLLGPFWEQPPPLPGLFPQPRCLCSRTGCSCPPPPNLPVAFFPRPSPPSPAVRHTRNGLCQCSAQALFTAASMATPGSYTWVPSRGGGMGGHGLGGWGVGNGRGGGIGLVPCSLLVGVFHPCCGKRRSGLILLSSSPSPRLSSCYPLWGGRSQPHLLPIHGGGSPVPTPSPEVPHHGRVLLHHVLHHLLDVLHTDFIWQDDSSGVQAGSAQSGQCPWGVDSP